MGGRPGVATISNLAFLLNLQGSGQLGMALIGTLYMPIGFFYAGRTGQLPDDLDAAIYFAWHILAALAGAFTLEAARRNRRYRDRRKGQFALWLGPPFCLLGIPILLYGLWAYRRPAVIQVFAQAEAGASAWEIEHA